METIYFLSFCVGIAYIIYWALTNDDQLEFTGQERSKKFGLSRPTKDPQDIAEQTDSLPPENKD